MTAYTAQNLTKTYGSRTVLNINRLEMEAGKIYGLLGPNGAGKTTLLHVLGFLEQPSSGHLEFLGQSVNFRDNDLQSLRQHVVVVEQSPVMFSTTVEANLEFGLKIRKLDKAKRARIVDEVLDLVDMRFFKHTKAHTLSGGEIQRVALARALALSPKVLLCDEPTASVDVENQSAIVSVLKQINKEKKISIVFTTHDRLLAVSLAHQTLVLSSGQLVSASYDNVFPGKVEQVDGLQVRCHLTESVSLLLDSDRLPVAGERCRVFIDPKKLDLHPGDYVPKSSKYLQGRVVQLMEEAGLIRVVVNVGFLLTVLMDRQQYEAKRPGVGDLVTVSLGLNAAILY